ncbi:MAG: hypothetical protein RIF41_23745, partial [Polyangiaceae bacterium]
MRGFWAPVLQLVAASLLAAGCGGDICDEAREAFCQKACACEDGRCLVRLGGASLQYYESITECVDLAGPQICDSEGREEDADACLQAVSSMEDCGDDVAPDECVVS